MRLAILISGSGSTAEAVIKACRSGRLKNVEPGIVISSNPNASGIAKAKKLHIKTQVVDPKQDDLLGILKKNKIDLVSQNGWLPLTPKEVVDHYRGKIINQHPGPLDPDGLDFGGSRMYGARVVCARIAYEWAIAEKKPWTASTIHFVSEEFDKGDLISMAKMPIPKFARPTTIQQLKEKPEKLLATTEKVQAKLLPIEHENVIATIQRFANGEKIKGFRLKQRLIPETYAETLEEAKRLAIKLFPSG